MHLRSGKVTYPIIMDIETIYNDLRKTPDEEKEEYVKRLIINRVDIQIRKAISSLKIPMSVWCGYDDQTSVEKLSYDVHISKVLCICTNIFSTSDENIERFVYLFPMIVPVTIRLLSNPHYGYDSSCVIGNLTACMPVCVQMVMTWNFIETLETAVLNLNDYFFSSQLHTYICNIIYNISRSSMLLVGFQDRFHRILSVLIDHASDTEAFHFLVCTLRKFPIYPSDLGTLLYDKLELNRFIISALEKDIKTM